MAQAPVEAVAEHLAVVLGGTPAQVVAIARDVLADRPGPTASSDTVGLVGPLTGPDS